MDRIQGSGRYEYVISDPGSDRQMACDSPTDVALVASSFDHAFHPNDEAVDENMAKLHLVIMMVQYPECVQFIRSMFWNLIDRGEGIIAASGIVVAEMRKRRPAIIAAREAPQQQALDDIRAQRARIQAETAQIEVRNTQMDRVRDCAMWGIPTVSLAAAGGWIAGLAGAIGGGTLGFLSPSLYHRFFGGEDRQQDPA